MIVFENIINLFNILIKNIMHELSGGNLLTDKKL